MYFSLLVNEIQAFDAQRELGNEPINDEQMEISSENEEILPFTKDYKYTSLNKSVCVLEEFLTKFEKTETKNNDLFWLYT